MNLKVAFSSDKGKLWYLWFDDESFMANDVSFFPCLLAIFMSSLKKCLSSLPNFNCFFFFLSCFGLFSCQLVTVLCVFWVLNIYQIYDLEILSPILEFMSSYSFFFNINLFILIGGWLLYNIVLVLPYINMNLPQVYTCSLSRPPLPSPSPYHLWVIPVHQSQASSIMHQTWTGGSFHIWYYTSFNAIPPNHPTLFLSHRVQKSVLCICVSFAVLHTGLSLTSF